MEPVEKQLLLRDLGSLGYPLVESSRTNVEETLIRALQNNDIRMLEGIPVVLSHVLTSGRNLDFEQIENALPRLFRRRFRLLCAVTYFFFVWVEGADDAQEKLRNYLKHAEPGILDEVRTKISNRSAINVAENIKLDIERL
ncbi:MAG: hypothetical protein AB1589_46100, partial [Cyanobacteriota bacterium]